MGVIMSETIITESLKGVELVTFCNPVTADALTNEHTKIHGDLGHIPKCIFDMLKTGNFTVMKIFNLPAPIQRFGDLIHLHWPVNKFRI